MFKNWALLGTHFNDCGIHFGSLLHVWDDIWSTFVNSFWVKKRIGAPEAPPEAPKWNRPIYPHPFRHHLGACFWQILFFCMNWWCFSIVCSRLCFGDVFGVFLNRWEQWNPLKTLRRPSKTEGATNQQKKVQGQVWDGFGVHFRCKFADKCVFLLKKISARKQPGKQNPQNGN